MNWLKLGIIKISPWHFKQLRWLSGVLWITLDSWPWQSYGMSHHIVWLISWPCHMTVTHGHVTWPCHIGTCLGHVIQNGSIVILNVFLWRGRIIFAWRFCGFVFCFVFIFQHFFQIRFHFCFLICQKLKKDFRKFENHIFHSVCQGSTYKQSIMNCLKNVVLEFQTNSG